MSELPRKLGDWKGAQPGPLVILVGGIHGNESAGVSAIQEVFARLGTYGELLRGRVVGLVGNLAALRVGQRYLHYDLNRCWTQEHMVRLSAQDPREAMAEDLEVMALSEMINDIEAEGKYAGRVLADLHTTSSEDGNFVVIPESEAEHPVAKALMLPAVVDIDKYLKGTLLRYMVDEGYVAFAFEGGKMGERQAVDLHVAGIWSMLAAAGCLPEVPEVVAARAQLAQWARGLPQAVRVAYHHRVHPSDEFVMNPGFRNFVPVEAGEVVARDRNGAIEAPCEGLMFLPLYQAQGDDGFFLVNPV